MLSEKTCNAFVPTVQRFKVAETELELDFLLEHVNPGSSATVISDYSHHGNRDERVGTGHSKKLSYKSDSSPNKAPS